MKRQREDVLSGQGSVETPVWTTSINVKASVMEAMYHVDPMTVSAPQELMVQLIISKGTAQ